MIAGLYFTIGLIFAYVVIRLTSGKDDFYDSVGSAFILVIGWLLFLPVLLLICVNFKRQNKISCSEVKQRFWKAWNKSGKG